MEKYKKIVERLKNETYWSGSSGPGSREIHPLICDEAATAITDLLARAEAAESELEPVKADRARWKQIAETQDKRIDELYCREIKAERQLDAALADLEATRAALAEAHGIAGVEPKTLFGVPLGRLYELAESYKAGRCVIFPDLKGLFGLDVLSDILNRRDFESYKNKINREAWKHLLDRFERKV